MEATPTTRTASAGCLCGSNGFCSSNRCSGGEEEPEGAVDHARCFGSSWEQVKPLLQGISAHVDGVPCCDWIGKGGAGHFVKMVHNGIEYGDMQLIGEVYDLMRRLAGLGNEEMHQVFAQWNEGDLDSYLIEITKDILAYKEEDGRTC